MKRVLSTVLLLALVGCGRVAAGDDPKPVRDPLPRAKTVQWDATTFEDAPAFEVVRREVKGNTVTWVLANKRGLGTEIIFGYQAALYDADGVKIGVIGIETTPFLLNTQLGERNRFSLHMPQPEKWQAVRKVVIMNGQYGH
jgi:hypothetical protein